jgi:DNA-binding LytR/AlgR family response regulator
MEALGMETLPVNNDPMTTHESGQRCDGPDTRSLASARLRRCSSGLSNSVLERKTAVLHQPKAGCTEAYTARIIFKARGRILFIPVSEIRWIGAEENYVRICTDKETHLLRETMTGLEQKLDPRMFLRVHRSAIVNLQFVKEVRTESQGDFVVHLVNRHKLSMSRSYHSRLGNLLTRVSDRVA